VGRPQRAVHTWKVQEKHTIFMCAWETTVRVVCAHGGLQRPPSVPAAGGQAAEQAPGTQPLRITDESPGSKVQGQHGAAHVPREASACPWIRPAAQTLRQLVHRLGRGGLQTKQQRV